MAEQRGSGSRWDEYGRVSTRFHLAYLVEVETGVFEVTTDRDEATHALIETEGGVIETTALGTVGAARMVQRDADTVFAY